MLLLIKRVDVDQVIQPVPRRHAYKGASRPGVPTTPQSARHRLLKKLGMPAKAPKNKFLVRPVRRIVQQVSSQPQCENAMVVSNSVPCTVDSFACDACMYYSSPLPIFLLKRPYV